MQVIQPKVKEIQKKFEGDQAKIGMELLELYKREGVNPLGSCLPLLIQMPILIVLYWVINGIGDPTNGFFLYGPLASFNIASISTTFA
jgi:YidC/Oxa1 family membrane protein insertase